jgi:hypothetical protein
MRRSIRAALAISSKLGSTVVANLMPLLPSANIIEDGILERRQMLEFVGGES